jgi:hypothetical protein
MRAVSSYPPIASCDLGEHSDSPALPGEADGEPGPCPAFGPRARSGFADPRESLTSGRDLREQCQPGQSHPADGDRRQPLDRQVLLIGEVRPVTRQRGGRAGHDLRVQSRQRYQPVARRGVPVRPAGRRAHLPLVAPGFGAGTLPRYPRHRQRAGERGEQGRVGAAGELGVGPQLCGDGDRDVRWQVPNREQDAQVVGDRVEPAGVHDPRPTRARGRVVAQVHPVDELRLAGEVDVVGALPSAGRDQRLAVVQVGADGGDDDLGGRRDRAQRIGLADVGVQQR